MTLWPFGPRKPKPEKPKPDSLPSMGVDVRGAATIGIKAEDPIDEPQGLKSGFRLGELIAWKGIWFRVTRVKFDELTLVPERMTGQRAKSVQAARGS